MIALGAAPRRAATAEGIPWLDSRGSGPSPFLFPAGITRSNSSSRFVCHLLPGSAREVLRDLAEKPAHSPTAAAILARPRWKSRRRRNRNFVIEMPERFHPAACAKGVHANEFRKGPQTFRWLPNSLYTWTQTLALWCAVNITTGVAGAWILLQPTIASLRKKNKQNNSRKWRTVPCGRARSFNYVNAECLDLQSSGDTQTQNTCTLAIVLRSSISRYAERFPVFFPDDDIQALSDSANRGPLISSEYLGPRSEAFSRKAKCKHGIVNSRNQSPYFNTATLWHVIINIRKINIPAPRWIR